MEESRNQLIRRGDTLLEVDRFGDAILAYQQALAESPDDPYVLTCIARAYRFGGDYDKSKEFASLAIEANPDYGWPYQELAVLRLLANDAKGAYELAYTSVQLMPESYFALGLLGRSAFGLDRNEEAREIANMVIEMAPDEIEGYELLALIAQDEDDPVTAVRYLEKALEIEPENPDLIESLAGAQSRLRDDESSVELYQAALASNPGDLAARRALKVALIRLVLLGDRGKRWRSPAAVVSIGLGVYLTTWFVLHEFTSLSMRSALLNQIGFVLLPVLATLLIPLLRNDVIGRRFPHLKAAYRYEQQAVRKETWYGSLVIVFCIVGASVIMHRAGIDPLIAWSPVWLPLALNWLLILIIPVALLRATIVDNVVNSSESYELRAIKIARRQRQFLAFTSALLMALTVWTQYSVLFVAALVAFFWLAVSGFKQSTYLTAAATVVFGISLAFFADRLPAIIDLQPRIAGFIVTLFGGGMLFKAARESLSAWLQRRKVKKLLDARGAAGG